MAIEISSLNKKAKPSAAQECQHKVNILLFDPKAGNNIKVNKGIIKMEKLRLEVALHPSWLH